MPIVQAVDRQGVPHELVAPVGTTLMEQLRDLEDGVAAICGGMCACATCHVDVDAEWLARLPQPLAEATDMLADVSTRRGVTIAPED